MYQTRLKSDHVISFVFRTNELTSQEEIDIAT